jgi:hypothetical protein
MAIPKPAPNPQLHHRSINLITLSTKPPIHTNPCCLFPPQIHSNLTKHCSFHQATSRSRADDLKRKKKEKKKAKNKKMRERRRRCRTSRAASNPTCPGRRHCCSLQPNHADAVCQFTKPLRRL